MRFIPFDRLELVTELTPKEVHELLKKNTHNDSFLTIFSDTNKLLEGTVEQLGNFKIKRHIRYRNSFIPIMIGNYERNSTGTKISVRFRMHLAVIIFMVFWLTGALLAFAVGLTGTFSNINSGGTFLAVATGLLLFGYLITIVGFNYELSKAKKLLEELFGKQ